MCDILVKNNQCFINYSMTCREFNDKDKRVSDAEENIKTILKIKKNYISVQILFSKIS